MSSITGSDLYLKQIAVGPMQNFAYLVGSRSRGECFAVDPAWEPQTILDQAAKDQMTIKGLLVTHYHQDHCGGNYHGHQVPGVAELHGALGVKVYANTHEIEGIIKVTGLAKNDFHVCHGGDVVDVGGVAIKLIHTPGHTPGSQCLLCESQLISGDTLFISGCGRVDLPGGNGAQLYDSLRKISELPGTTEVLPGHHYDPQVSASIDYIKKVNPHLREATMEGFRSLREKPRES